MSQPWNNHAPPQGWQGQWPPPAGVPMPPGFPGPPPVPQNVPVPPSAWQAGYWQFNPTGRNPGVPGAQYPNPQPNASRGPWAPSNHWANQAAAQQQNQNFNPHKKIPRAPDASYYNYKLVDNPLGLEGMVPRDESHHDHLPGDGPHTPWIWNPPTLRESSERPIAARDFPQSRRSMDAGQGGNQPQIHHRRASADNHRYNENSLAEVQRREANTMPDISRNHPLNANPMFGPPLGPLNKIPAGFVPQQQHSGRYQPAPHQLAPHLTPPGFSEPYQQAPRQPAPHQPATQHIVRKSESFTEKKELHPTFSPQIVRTPDHYHRKNIDATNASSATRQANIYRPGGNTTYIPRSQNAIDEMNGTLANEPSAQPLERHSSLPTNLSSLSTIAGLSGYTEEPSSLLSPVIGATPKASMGQIRSRTDPSPGRSNTLSTIPESSSSHVGVSRNIDFGLAPLSAPPDNFIPLNSARSRHPTPHPRRENPLPPPPQDIQRSVPSPQSRPPAHYSRKVRKGLWNRRGDHLTSDMHVVFAPSDKTYPSELSRYPDKKEGYYDAQLNQHVPWIEDRPELPASLPHRGQPPTQPYESFVVYAYIP